MRAALSAVWRPLSGPAPSSSIFLMSERHWSARLVTPESSDSLTIRTPAATLAATLEKTETVREDPMYTTGINHVALVARDMQETVKFYTEVLEMPLIKTLSLPDGGQHFFFDTGGTALAFFWWPETPAAAPGVASVKSFPAESRTAIGSMNHLAFDVPQAELEACIARLKAAGVPHHPEVINHDDSPATVAAEIHPGVFVRSVYFTDPNGVMLEFAAFTKPFGPEDALVPPAGKTVEI